MSHFQNILTGAEAAIRANSTFSAASIYQREEIVGDVGATPQQIIVFLFPVSTKANDQVDAQKFTTQTLGVTIAFEENTRAENEGERDVVWERKEDYNDAMITALRTNMPNSTNPISNVFQVDYKETNYNPPMVGETELKIYRLQQIWEYQVYES